MKLDFESCTCVYMVFLANLSLWVLWATVIKQFFNSPESTGHVSYCHHFVSPIFIVIGKFQSSSKNLLGQLKTKHGHRIYLTYDPVLMFSKSPFSNKLKLLIAILYWMTLNKVTRHTVKHPYSIDLEVKLIWVGLPSYVNINVYLLRNFNCRV